MAKRRRNSIKDDDTPKLNREQSKAQARFLLNYLKPHRFKLALALSVMIISSVVSLAFPAMIGKLVDIATGVAKTDYSLTAVAGFIITLLVIQSVTRYFVSTVLATVSETTLAGLRTKLFGKIITLPMSFFAERRVGELASRLSSDLSLIQDVFTFSFLEALRQIVFLIGGVLFIATKSLQLTGMILLCVPPLAIAAVIFGRYIRKFSTQAQDALAEGATIVEESLQAISSVKSFVNENFELNRYSTAIQKGVKIGIKGAKLRSAFVSFILFSIFGGISFVIWYGGSLVRSGELTIGDLTSFLMYAMFVAGALGSFAELFGQIQKALGASVRVQEILAQETEEFDSDEKNWDKSPRELRSVEFRSVDFSYPGRKDISALRDVSFRIHSGERIAFVGESGAGKSTSAALIQRFYEPSSGEILFDGTPSSQISLANVRQNVGIVPQDIVLFGGTIAENIRYGSLSATDEELWKAAELANATEFIEQFPEKLQTVVGERGVKLSGGQRQRIAIARAILKNPPILILDEATSSLDSQTEALIQSAMERLMQGRTTIIIAHRLSTIRKCDRIFVFSKGAIIESGTHRELLERENSLYGKLCALQFGETEKSEDKIEEDDISESFYEKTKHLAGSIDSRLGDLSYNKKYRR